MPDFLDKAKELAHEHDEQVDQALDKVADLVDGRTGGSHHDQIEQAVDKVQGFLDQPTEPTAGKDVRRAAPKKPKPS